MTSAKALMPNTSLFELSPNIHTTPFWEAARDHRLVVSSCTTCRTFVMPPTGLCPRCRTQSIEWITVSGRARLYTYTVVRHAPVPALAGSIPYVIAVVKLPDAGGVKLITNIVGCEVDDLSIGQELEVVWNTRGDGITVPRFRPIVAP